MDFLSNLADSTPIVGPIKGLYHYARGEEEKGDEAMYQSTRTSAVIAGGIFGGPPGAMAAGLATDAAASALMDEEKGLVNSCKNIGEDLAAGRDPTGSITSAGFQLTLDGISGYGGSSGGASNASARVAGKTMKRGVEQGIQKSVRISSAEAAKMVTRKSSERAAAKTAQRAFLAFTHVGSTAAQRTQLEYERERKERERDRKWREQQQREREWREQQQSEREWREQQQREREWREQQEREREWREQQQREREWRESREQQRVREWREWIEQEQKEREWREWREQEQRETKSREREHRESQQQKAKKQEECKKREQRANSEKQKPDTSGSSSGSSQPPQDNKDNNKKRKGKKKPSLFEPFMTLLRRILKTVYGNESEPFTTIFESLPEGDREYLSKVLVPVEKSGTLEAVIESVVRMFKQYFPKDISFLNFLSLLEFVQTYITEELQERTLISSGTETAETKMKPKERRDNIISEIANERSFIGNLTKVFDTLKNGIEAETATWNTELPNFRDIFAAVYHYFKHRRLPADGRILSIKEYYDWIRKFLKEIEQTEEFTELKDSKRKNYVHEVFVPMLHRRFKVVITLRNGKIVLSSAFVVTMIHPDDKEKHAISIVAEVLTAVFMAITLLFILKCIVFTAPILLLNTVSIVFNCIAFTVKLLLNTLLFFFACLIFILKVLLTILLLFAFAWFLFFYLPDQR